MNFAGPERLIGRFVDVIVTDALAHSLRGRLAETDAGAQMPRLAAAGG